MIQINFHKVLIHKRSHLYVRHWKCKLMKSQFYKKSTNYVNFLHIQFLPTSSKLLSFNCFVNMPMYIRKACVSFHALIIKNESFIAICKNLHVQPRKKSFLMPLALLFGRAWQFYYLWVQLISPFIWYKFHVIPLNCLGKN